MLNRDFAVGIILTKNAGTSASSPAAIPIIFQSKIPRTVQQ
jgi:hypothetical protein